MVGQWLRLNRLFSEGRRAVIVALDQGQFLTAARPMADVGSIVGDLCDADAMVISPGMLRYCGHAFDSRGAPLAIMRVTWSTVHCTGAEYFDSAGAQMLSARNAQAMGADMLIASLNLTETDAGADRDSVVALSQVVAEARDCGLPLMTEVWPVHSAKLASDQLARQVDAGCRVAAELGAGVVVSHFTGTAFGDLVKSCPAPVLATSQNPALRPLDVLALTYQAVKAGARGAMFGPQILSSPNPAALVKALSRVVKQEADPDAAAAQFGVR